MNPIGVIGVILVALGIGFGSYHSGHSNGVAEQSVKDQKQFDDINEKLTKQKAEASTLYKTLADQVIAKQAADDEFKTQLEKQREIYRTDTDALRRKYAATSLRFTTTTAQDPRGGGGGGGSPQGAGAEATTAEGPTVVQLPDQITADLRQLTLDADFWLDEYRACYTWANRPSLGVTQDP
jgi:hypothetical protein